MTGRILIPGGSPYEPRIGYSRAVVQGDWCFVAGTTGLDPRSRTYAPTALAQTRTALGIVRDTLERAGFSLAQVVRANYILTDRSFVEEIAPALGEAFGQIRPAATMIIADLVDPAMKVEIEVTAFRG